MRLREVARVGLRLPAVAAVTSVLLGSMLAGLPLARAVSSRAKARWRALHQRAWSRLLLRILGVRSERRGEPPAEPCLLVANHLGYLDIVVLAAHLDAVFVAKAEVSRWPVLGFLSRRVGTIFVQRGRRLEAAKAVAAIEDALALGVAVILFPEGTSTGGDEVRPFRPPLLEASARSGRGVWYATLGYATPPGAPPAREAVCWWGDMTFGPHLLRLLALPSIGASLSFGPAPLAHGERKGLAERLHQAVVAQLPARWEERWT